jgi:hypothetical protein
MTYGLEISTHHQRFRVSTGSLPPQKKKCMMAVWHQFDRIVGCDASYGDEIKIKLLESVLQRYREDDY